MSFPTLATLTLSKVPSRKSLLFELAVRKLKHAKVDLQNIFLPKRQFRLDRVFINEAKYRAFQKVVGWDAKSEFVHPCYLHTLAFPLQVKLLLEPDFPFSLLGIVHIQNKITQFRPLKIEEELTVSASYGALTPHPKGWMFSIEIHFYSGSELIWQSSSTNLVRIKHSLLVDRQTNSEIVTFLDQYRETWKLDANLGRRYAKVSGDFNPIHLAKWSAKLFGFKQPIVHGMWTKSFCVSTLNRIYPDLFYHGFAIETVFKQPLYLPNHAETAIQRGGSVGEAKELNFKVAGTVGIAEIQPVYLVGKLRSIK